MDDETDGPPCAADRVGDRKELVTDSPLDPKDKVGDAKDSAGDKPYRQERRNKDRSTRR